MMKKEKQTILASAAIASMGVACSVHAATILNPSSHDSIVTQSQDGSRPAGTYELDSLESEIGEQGSSGDRLSTNVVFGFTLPTLAAGETIASAVFSIDVTRRRGNDQNNSGANPRLDLYLLDTTAPDETFGYEGPSDPATNVSFVDRYDGGAATDVTFSLTGSALSTLQGFYTGNTPDQTEAFFRLNLDYEPVMGGSNIEEFEIDTANTATSLTLTAIPEASTAWLALGGLALLRRRRR